MNTKKILLPLALAAVLGSAGCTTTSEQSGASSSGSRVSASQGVVDIVKEEGTLTVAEDDARIRCRKEVRTGTRLSRTRCVTREEMEAHRNKIDSFDAGATGDSR